MEHDLYKSKESLDSASIQISLADQGNCCTQIRLVLQQQTDTGLHVLQFKSSRGQKINSINYSETDFSKVWSDCFDEQVLLHAILHIYPI